MESQKRRMVMVGPGMLGVSAASLLELDSGPVLLSSNVTVQRNSLTGFFVKRIGRSEMERKWV